MAMKSVVAAAWIALFGVVYWRIWDQRNHDKTWSQAAKNWVIAFVRVATLFILPELLVIVVFMIPCLLNFVERKEWKVFSVLSWWFQRRCFVGRGMREGLVDHIKYGTFWVLVLSSKFSFSYFLQIKPLIAPTKAILQLDDVRYEWHQFFSGRNKFAAVLVWIPVVLIYFMDIQIWYAIFCSVTGAAVGLLDHLGELRNMEELRLRFQFFASAIQFNLMPEEQLLNGRGRLRNKFKDAIRRFKLRYGFGKPYKKLESNQIEATKFAIIWNEIIKIFREEDILSDHEEELLELPQNSWNVRVVRWPCFLLCNELLLALSQAKELAGAPDRWLWYKICKNEYRRCAVIEAYDCIRHLLLEILKQNSEEKSIVAVLFQKIDHFIQIEKFTREFNASAMPKLHTKLVKLVEILNKPKKDLRQVVNTLQALCEIYIRDFIKEERSNEQLREDGLAPRDPVSTSGLLFENAVELSDLSNENFYRQLRRLHIILTSRESFNDIPLNPETKRRIALFSNSMFMNIPQAPLVEKMMAFSVLTPYYNEEVLFSREQLRNVNEGGTSILYYLQTIHVNEWKNFMERMQREGMMTDEEIGTTKQRDLRLWASYRGQTLTRTVRGMMYYYRAFRMLQFLDSA